MESSNSKQDPIKLLIDWVEQHGGAHNVVVQEDKNGVRGLYASRNFNIPIIQKSKNPTQTAEGLSQSQEPQEHPFLVKIPNKLIISPHHINHQIANSVFTKVKEGEVFSPHKYKEIFKEIPELFDPKYKYAQNANVKSRIDNEYAEYFQLSYFLINERLKGQQSFWYPFINYLPPDIQTLYSYPDKTPISHGSTQTLISSLQLSAEDEDLHAKIVYDRQIHDQNKQRFLQSLQSHKEQLNQLLGLESLQQQEEYWSQITDTMFDWAWMNVGTRCFGTYHIPGEIAMMPLLDLMNHSVGEEKLGYFVQPIGLNIKMLERYDTNRINKELELDYQAELQDYEDYDATLEWESQDFDQHYDDYGDRYYNYLPKLKKPLKQRDPDSESETEEDKYIQQDPLEKIWDLNSDKIFFGKRLMNKDNTQIEEGEELHLCYGERANSFLLVEYGFTLPNNRYDFVRLNTVTLESIQKILYHSNNKQIANVNSDQFKANLQEKYKMKPQIRIELKLSGLHRDLLRYLRCLVLTQQSCENVTNEQISIEQEVQVLEMYKQIAQQRLNKYPTTLQQDKELLEVVQNKLDGIEYHWMYQYVLIYRLGQKEILEHQITYCTQAQEVLLKSQGDFLKFKEGVLGFADTNTMADYIDEARTSVKFDSKIQSNQ